MIYSTQELAAQTLAPPGNHDLIRGGGRFFSGVPHPHLLGGCRPNLVWFYSSASRGSWFCAGSATPFGTGAAVWLSRTRTSTGRIIFP